MHNLPTLKNHPFFLAVLITAFLFSCFFLMAHPSYETNDDFGMMCIASGTLFGEPSESLIYTNVIIGKFLRSLYTMTDAINWYSFYLYAVHFISMTFLLYLFLYYVQIRLGMICFFLLFLFFELRLLLTLQYTTTAFAALQTGLFLLLYPPVKQRENRIRIFATGLLLLVLGSLIREKVLYLVLLLSVPLLLHRYLTTKSKHVLILISLAVAFSVGGVLYNRHFYQHDPHWKSFLEYNRLRESIHDRPQPAHDHHTLSALEGVGWRWNDLLMFQSWFFPDPDIFSKERLEALTSLPLDQKRPPEETWQHLKNSFWNLRLYLWFTALNLVLAVVLFNGRKFHFLAFVLFYALLGFGLCWFLESMMKLPERVSLPIIFFINTLLFFLFLHAKSVKEQSAVLPAQGVLKSLQKVFFCLLAVSYAGLGIFHFQTLSAQNKANATQHAAFNELVQILSHEFRTSSDIPPVYIAVGASFPYEWTPALSNAQHLKGVSLLPFGWNTHSPTHKGMLKNHSMTNVFNDLYEKEHLVLLSAAHFPDLLRLFVKEHFDDEIQFDDVTGRVVSDNPLIAAYTENVRFYKVYRDEILPSPTP